MSRWPAGETRRARQDKSSLNFVPLFSLQASLSAPTNMTRRRSITETKTFRLKEEKNRINYETQQSMSRGEAKLRLNTAEVAIQGICAWANGVTCSSVFACESDPDCAAVVRRARIGWRTVGGGGGASARPPEQAGLTSPSPYVPPRPA